MLGDLGDWTPLDAFLAPYITQPEARNSAVASSFAATLELVREGKLQMRQDKAYSPLYLKAGAQKPTMADAASAETGSL